MNKNIINRKLVASSLMWKMLERISSQSINFIVQVVIARILMPEDFGNLAILIAFTNFAAVFVQSGISTAIIQKKNIDNVDLSTTFWISFVIAFSCYSILYYIAPHIALYFANESLVLALRVISLALFFDVANAIHTAILTRKMEFKKMFLRSLFAVPMSGIIGIYMAVNGFGLWALVFQYLINQILSCIVLWMATKWRISFKVSIDKAKSIFSFSGKILLSSVLINVYENVRTLVIGKVYTSDLLAYYDRGQSYTGLIIQSINTSLSSVLLPVFSKKQGETVEIKNMMRRSISLSSFVIFPVLAGFAAVAKPLVLLLLTDKWIECVPYIMIFCLYRAPYPIFTVNAQSYYAKGRSDIILKLEVIRCVLNFIVLIVTVRYGVLAIAYGMTGLSIASVFFCMYPNIKLVDYKIQEQIKDIFPMFIRSFFMFILVFSIQFLHLSPVLTLLIQIPTGVVIYFLMSTIVKDKNIPYLLELLRSFTKKKYL